MIGCSADLRDSHISATISGARARTQTDFRDILLLAADPDMEIEVRSTRGHRTRFVRALFIIGGDDRSLSQTR
jgi:hypothetical protein